MPDFADLVDWIIQDAFELDQVGKLYTEPGPRVRAWLDEYSQSRYDEGYNDGYRDGDYNGYETARADYRDW